MSTTKKVLLIILLSILGVALFFAIYFFAIYFSADSIALDESKLKANFSNLTVYASNDKEIDELSTVYSYIPFSELSENVVDAFVSVEDKRFFEHNGIDYKRVLKAMYNNLRSFSYKEGASTISQQLVKNTLLTNEKTFSRKIKEMRLSRLLEKKYSKEEILAMYLSAIYFGNGKYGIKEASIYYFNKTPDKLSISESATLAGLIKSPNNYSPYNNMEKAKERRNIVLKLMYQNEKITENELKSALNEEIILDKNDCKEQSKHYKYVLNEASEVLNLPESELLNKNLKIYTSLNYDKMQHIGEIFEETMEKSQSGLNYCVAIYNNNTKEIEQIFENTNSSFLYKKRNIGSIIKPIFVYGVAINENLISPLAVISDTQTSFGDYSPKNYSDLYYGDVNLRTAISKSLNIPAVKVYQSIPKMISSRYFKKIDVNLTEKDGLAVALGGNEEGLSIYQVMQAYSSLTSSGEIHAPSFIRKIVDSKGKTIYENVEKSEKFFSEETAFLVADMMKDVASIGTAKILDELNLNLAAKTGTAGQEDGNTDAFCVGISGNYTVIAWCGKENGEKFSNDVKGSSLPTILTKNTFENVNSSRLELTKPDSVEKVTIDLYELKKNGKYVLADENTPPKYKMSEYVQKKNMPQKASTAFKKPTVKIVNFEALKGKYILTLETEKIYGYTVFDKKGNVLKKIEGDGKIQKIILDTLAIEPEMQVFVQAHLLSKGEITSETMPSKVVYSALDLVPDFFDSDD